MDVRTTTKSVKILSYGNFPLHSTKNFGVSTSTCASSPQYELTVSYCEDIFLDCVHIIMNIICMFRVMQLCVYYYSIRTYL